MSLHTRLLARLDEEDIGDNLASALRVVVELPAPEESAGYARCDGCLNAWGESADWPCSTVQAIARELGVQEDDRG